MSQIPAPGLTPKDKRTVLDALVTAIGHLHDQLAACVICRGQKPCPVCDERLDKIADYDNLAVRLRSGS